MNNFNKFKFPKAERLCHEVQIKALFSKGKNVFTYPFKVWYELKENEGETPPQVVFSVSKRVFKKATDRNWIKRRLREIYRLNKHFLAQEGKYAIRSMAIVYVAKEKIAYAILHKKFSIILKQLAGKQPNVSTEEAQQVSDKN